MLLIRLLDKEISMYIAPNSTIILCKGLKIDNSYSNTIYFSNADAQYKYFTSKAVVTLTNNSYVRKGLGRVRVGVPIGSIYNCNYLMYRNISFENKWFYAFVTSVEYVNNQATDITFDIDVLQTWMFNYSPSQCFVDREHSSTDNPGDNRINEGLDTGDYTYLNVPAFSQTFRDKVICVASTLNNDGDDTNVDGSIYGGMYSGLTFRTYELNSSGAKQVTEFLEKASEAGHEDSIVSIFVAPRKFVQGDGIQGENSTDNGYKIHTPTALGTFRHEYKPRNKKLLTYPYVGLYLYNSQGASEILKYELFNDPSNINFTLWASSGCAPNAIVIPTGYDSYSNGYAQQYIMELSGYPQCAWTTDTFRAWLAKNEPFLSLDEEEISTTTSYKAGSIEIAGKKDKANTIAGIANRASNVAQDISSAVGYSTSLSAIANPGQAVANGVNAGINAANQAGQAANDIYQYEQNKAQRTLDAAYNNSMAQINMERLMAQKEVARMNPPSYHGSSTGNARLYTNNFEIGIYKFSIRDEFARRIDDYWDLFGYKTNRVKIPNRAVRPHWTYCKTQGCTFSGSVPNEDMEQIRALYDGGIRWWKNGDEIGNFSLNNQV